MVGAAQAARCPKFLVMPELLYASGSWRESLDSVIYLSSYFPHQHVAELYRISREFVLLHDHKCDDYE